MKTLIFTIDDFIEYMKKAKAEGLNYVVFGTNNLLQATAPSDRKPSFKLRFDIAGDAFAERDIRPLMDNKNVSFCGVLLEDEQHLNQELVKKLKENKAKGIEFKFVPKVNI